MLAFVAGELVLRHVGSVENRLHREQRERAQQLELFFREVRLPESAPFFEKVGLANGGEKLVAEPLALRGALHETCDVDELHDGGDGLFRLNDVRDAIEPRIRHLDHADVRFDGAKRIVLGRRAGGSERIEQRRLPDVGESHDSELEHPRKLNALFGSFLALRAAAAILIAKVASLALVTLTASSKLRSQLYLAPHIHPPLAPNQRGAATTKGRFNRASAIRGG